MSKPRLLVVVPDSDLSIELFFTDNCRARMDIESIPYKEAMFSADRDWDFIYIRGSGFQSELEDKEVINSLEHILQNKGKAYMVDGLHTFSDLLLEDKWRQFKIFADVMPTTKVIDSFETINIENLIIKKRISGRSRDIHFDLASLPEDAMPRDYIIQERLNIQIEYRVFMIGGQIILPLEIKSSKTETNKNKVIGTEKTASKEIKDICRLVSDRLKYDLVGLDIVKVGDQFYLLEANRSPMFVNYLKLSSKNLAESLIDYLLEGIETNGVIN